MLMVNFLGFTIFEGTYRVKGKSWRILGIRYILLFEASQETDLSDKASKCFLKRFSSLWTICKLVPLVWTSTTDTILDRSPRHTLIMRPKMR